MAHIKEEPLPDVGVIVGRFQVPELHDGHKDVLDYVCKRHRKVIVFLGVTALDGMPTRENPLDYQARRQMIQEQYPEVEILYIKDMQDDDRWSRKLDGQIKDLTTANQTVMLYGSRDSFISHYHGRFPTQELEAEHKVSGREIRGEIKSSGTKETADFRYGAVWFGQATFPKVHPTVDIAIFNEDETMMLLGRKEFESLWRLPGGFAEPSSESYEQDARREAMEETNVEVTDPVYVGSFKIDDWRYRAERDKIITLLFRAKVQFGEAKAGDDISEVKWFDIWDLWDSRLEASENQKKLDAFIMPNHQKLVRAAINFQGRN